MADGFHAGSVKRVARNIAWIEHVCCVPEGVNVGQPVRLRDWQREILTGIYGSPTRRAIISYGRKNGKGLALDTPIPTPEGWRSMADIRAGDFVFGGDGKPTRVTFVSETHVGLRCWRLTFSDGSSVVADEDHQWLTRHSYRPWAGRRINGTGRGGRWREDVVTTPQIAASVLRPRADGGIEHNHKIRVAAATVTPPRLLPLAPYVLGYWLGNGTSINATVTCGADDASDVQRELESEMGQRCKVRIDPRNGVVTLCMTGARTQRDRNQSVQARLRKLGVLQSKHIPSAYLSAGTSQRWALLQGLMDADGTASVNPRNGTVRCVYTSILEPLAHGVWRLARSLGLKATVCQGIARLDGKCVSDKYDVAFTADQSQRVFRLARKQVRIGLKSGKRSRTLSIVSCDPVPSVPTRCIQVAAIDSLFLCGDGCVPTHNTSLAACLLLLHLCGPEARPNAQLFSDALSRDQAAILFALAAKMVRLSPDLSAHVAIRDTAKQLVCRELGTLYRALSADAETAFGLSPSFMVHDELGQVRGPRSKLYEALETAAAGQPSPLSIVISTQAPTDSDLLSMLIDDAKKGEDPRTKLFLWTADIDRDPFDVETIKLANPAFGDFQNADEVVQQAESARRMPSREAAYRNLILNQRINLVNPFIARSTWEANGATADADVFEQAEVFVGLDLSARNDLTAVVAVAQDADGVWHVEPHFFVPQVGIGERAHRDRVPYDLWARQGFLHTTPGASVDYARVAEWLVEWCASRNVANIAFDRWRMDVFKAELSRLGAELPLVPFGQGFRDMTPALDALESELANHNMRHGLHPVLTMCAANAVATRDPAGNRKLDKSKATGRIDGMVALAMAMGVASANAMVVAPTSVYEARGIRFL